jgi:hypothetical protein
MILYLFLSGPDDSTFCHKIAAALNKGWKLHGSPVYAFDASANAMRCGQAVTKEIVGQVYDNGTRLEDW